MDCFLFIKTLSFEEKASIQLDECPESFEKQLRTKSGGKEWERTEGKVKLISVLADKNKQGRKD